MEEVYCASVVVDGKAVKSGLFNINVKEYEKLIRLVRKGAADCNGIGQIHHESTLVYECNAKGERTGGTWEDC